MHAPRYTYLPLLIPEIRENLVELALDDQQLAETDEKNWWLEEEEEGDHVDGSFAGQGVCRWYAFLLLRCRVDKTRHWPLDLIELHSTLSRPARPESSTSQPRALRLLLHLSAPPIEKLLMPNSIAACKTQFINQVKEADFVRWRNTNKVTSLRRADLEAGWDGIVQGDSDEGPSESS